MLGCLVWDWVVDGSGLFSGKSDTLWDCGDSFIASAGSSNVGNFLSFGESDSTFASNIVLPTLPLPSDTRLVECGVLRIGLLFSFNDFLGSLLLKKENLSNSSTTSTASSSSFRFFGVAKWTASFFKVCFFQCSKHSRFVIFD